MLSAPPLAAKVPETETRANPFTLPDAGISASEHWETELFLLRGEDRAGLLRRIQEVALYLDRNPHVELKDLAFTLSSDLAPHGSRLALVAGTAAELQSRLTRSARKLADPRCHTIKDSAGIYYFQEPLHPKGKLAFLFPGEGAQYLNMLADLCPYFPEVHDCFAGCDRAAVEAGRSGQLLSRFLFVPEEASEEERARAEKELRQLGNAMLIVQMADWAVFQLLGKLGLQADAIAGHSMGELPALWAAGCVDADSVDVAPLMDTMEALQRQEGEGLGADTVLLAVGAGRDQVAGIIERMADRSVYLAMDNCPHQVVVVGPSAPVQSVEAELQARRILCERLPFHRPYHTPMFKPFLGPLEKMFAPVTFRPARTPIYSCTTARPFPDDPEEIRRLTIKHWAEPVEFTQLIRNLHADGVRLFVEVGPRGNLSSFVEDILRGRPFAALPANVERRTGLTQLNHLAGQLAAHHVPLRLEHFYERRNPQRLVWQTEIPHLTVEPRHEENTQRILPNHEDGDITTNNAERGVPKPPDKVSGAIPQAPAQREAVLSSYLQVMEQFLDLQREMMEQFLARQRTGAPPSPSRVAEQDPVPPHESSDLSVTRRPMVGEIVYHEPGRELVTRRVLDLSEDRYAAQHTLGGRHASKVDPEQHGQPVMPMTFSLEMMAEVAATLFPGKVVVCIKDIKLFRWLPFDEDEPTSVEIAASGLGQDDSGRSQVAVVIRDLGNASRPGNDKWVAAEGTVVLDDGYPEPPDLGSFPLTHEVPCPISPEVVYRNLFHGPAFQGITSTDRIGDEGIEGQVRVMPRSDLFRSVPDPDLSTDPLLMDIVTHLLVCWHLFQPDQAGRILLPYEMRALEIYGPIPAEGDRLVSRGRLDQASSRHFRHTVEVLDSRGRLLYRLSSAGFWRFYTPFGDVNFHGPKDEYFLSRDWPFLHAPASANGIPGKKARAHRASPVCCMRLDPPTDLLNAAMRMASARVTLSPAEFKEFRGLQGSEKEINGWLFSRIAAKDVIRTLWREHFGERLYPADILLDLDEYGRLVARRRDGSDWARVPAVSMTHADGVMAALAAFVPHVGIDLERIRTRPPDWAGKAFGSAEREWITAFGTTPDEALTRLWCAKQAVAKTLGRRGIDPHSLMVRSADSATGMVHISAARSLTTTDEVGTAALLVRTARDGDLVVATTLCERASV
jgi:malonyl CoA-acyl carrier protein transacylase